ncbi:hypothetical protein CERZMDRAFT_109425 [Cercospora zeae-maydis SCOH1-5]|uniref:Uncharacterized protein n=1 Tax=Cercospora zeae-maydis SCOH1-5 TaxID=717836 RepID=A0A6A6FSU8_9PEZI|nr:hypothetical protein CERZMDRAFT_109425 [Cercospora zeae-maydis SCOH1-5]
MQPKKLSMSVSGSTSLYMVSTLSDHNQWTNAKLLNATRCLLKSNLLTKRRGSRSGKSMNEQMYKYCWRRL